MFCASGACKQNLSNKMRTCPPVMCTPGYKDPFVCNKKLNLQQNNALQKVKDFIHKMLLHSHLCIYHKSVQSI